MSKLTRALNNEAKVMTMKYRLASQKGRVTKLSNQVEKLQFLVRENIMTLEESRRRYTGNKYRDYAQAVTEIQAKYDGTAEWGVILAGNIIDIRAAFVINEGPQISKKDRDFGNEELKWANHFLEYNDLDKEVSQEFAKEAEIEGKLAIKLFPVKTEKKDDNGKPYDSYEITARYISWTNKKYTVNTSRDDYLDYTSLTWKPSGQSKTEKLEKHEFVYKKFGGRINKPNNATPKIMKCLTQVEDLDKALRDWREIDNIFANPILYNKCKDGEEVEAALLAFDNKNFKLRRMLAGVGELQYIVFDLAGIEALEKEITTLAKMISGTTGVSVQYLGLADLLKNRSTSVDLREMLVASTTKERQIWKGAYEELIHKAMVMYNKVENMTPLNPDLLHVEIPIVTEQQWEHLEKFFLPASLGGKLSTEGLLERIPGMDVEKEMKRIEDRELSEFEQLKKENEGLRNKDLENNLLKDDEKEEDE